MQRSQLPPHKTPTFVLPKWKLVHLAIPKAASTSIKWLLADLQGESRDRFYRTLSGETARYMTIHRRTRWRNTPMLHELSEAELAEISEENGWFFFSVVRHPFDRLWSAWQSKLLLREPPFINRYPSAPWPRMPARSSDIVEDFQDFAKALAGGTDNPLFSDRHFLPQTELLNLGIVPYSRIYRTSELRGLLKDLEAHLRPLGLDAMPDLVRHNENPLAPIASLFDDETTRAVAKFYASDIEAFGFSGVSAKELPDRHYSTEEIIFLRGVIERAERTLDLFTFASEHFHRQRRATEESLRLQARIDELEAERRGGGLRRVVRSSRRFRRFRELISRASASSRVLAHNRRS